MSGKSLVTNIVNQIDDVVRMQNAIKVSVVRIKIGTSCRITPEQFRQRFIEKCRGTPAEGARLDIEELNDWSDPRSQEIILDRLELEN